MSSITVADVNGDGKQDVVVLNACQSSDSDGTCSGGVVAVLLGNGDGTFQAAQSYDSGGSSAIQVAVTDLNGDGIPDVVTLNECVSGDDCTAGTFGVLLGNGDGTLQPVQAVNLGRQNESSMALGDVNGDGIPDLLVAYFCDPNDPLCTHGEIDELLGNGDGTFQTARSFVSGGFFPEAAELADVNHDGLLDLLLANCGNDECSNGSVNVLLGNGDGSFQTAQTYSSGGALASTLAVGDVNGDGNPDLLVANACISPGLGCNQGILGVLLGNGDGTFQPAQTYPTAHVGCVDSGYCPISISVMDVNGDDKLDVLMGQDLVLGNGDGTFQSSQPLTSDACILGRFAVADLNGDGRPDLSIADYLNDCGNTGVIILLNTTPWQTSTTLSSTSQVLSLNQPVTYTTSVTSQHGGPFTGTLTFKDRTITIATVPVSGNMASYTTSYSAAGTHLITAVYSGDTNNAQSTSSVLTEYVVSRQVGSKTAITSSVSPSMVGQPVSFTVTITSQYGPIPNGETVSFFDGTSIMGSAPTANGAAVFTTSALTARVHTIKATYSGDDIFQSSSRSLQQTVNSYASTVSLTAIPNPSRYGQAVRLKAVITSSAPGGPTGAVSFSSGNTWLGSAAVSAGSARVSTTKLPVGTTTIVANYSGDAKSAKSVGSATHTVNQANSNATLISSANPSVLGRVVKFTARVTSRTVLGTGIVTFMDGTAVLGSANLVGGVAHFSTSVLSSGAHGVKAIYPGTSNISGCASTVLTQAVK